MSWLALDWAETAPVADIYERHILVSLAGRAKKDGTGVYLSPATIARRGPCDVQVIKDRMKALRDRGVLGVGDQRLAQHIPANRRPVVYDLMIPASFYSPHQLRDTNEERAERGLGPLPLEDRPDLPDVEPSRKARSDKGTPNPRKTGKPGEQDRDPNVQPLTWEDGQGGVVDPPEESGAANPGGSATPPLGGLLDPAGGVYYTPKSLRENPLEETGEGVPSPGERTAGATAPDPDGPPAPSSPRKATKGDPSTWLCSEHLELLAADPGADVPPCGRCARVKEWGRGQVAAAERAAADVERTAEQLARECTWHDAAGFVVDPGTGLPFEPAVKCDHQRTPAEVAQLVAAHQAVRAPEPGRSRAQAAAVARVRATVPAGRPLGRRSRGRGSRPAVPTSTDGQEPARSESMQVDAAAAAS